MITRLYAVAITCAAVAWAALALLARRDVNRLAELNEAALEQLADWEPRVRAYHQQVADNARPQ